MALTKVGAGVLNIDDLYGFRNRIINGDMRIAQRSTDVTVGGTGYHTTDRWRFALSDGSVRLQQSTDAPPEFNNSFLMTVETPFVPTPAQACRIGQRIEGYTVADLGWGTPNAKPVTLSFWVKSSISGTYCIVKRGSNISYVAEYTINSSDTWEYKTITIPGPTTGVFESATFNRENGIGINFEFDLGSGTDRNGTPNQWITDNNFKTRTVNQTEWIRTTGATFNITGVQLEKGTVATPFERRPFGMELALCQRYYWKITPPSNNGYFGIGQVTSSTVVVSGIPFPVTMRVAPSALEQTGTASDYRVAEAGSAQVNCTSVPFLVGGTTTTQLGGVAFTSTSLSGTAGQSSQPASTTGGVGFLAWSAEL